MNVIQKFFIGTLAVIGAISTGVIGVGVLANIQNGDIQVPFVSEAPLNEEAKAEENNMSLCDALLADGDMDCSDFSDHSEAQSIYEDVVECTGYDAFKLDRDSDGLACETL